MPGTHDANRGPGDTGRGSFDAIGGGTAQTGGGVVNKLVCEDCGTVYYSAAAKTMVEQGETCAKCGARLLLDENGPVVVSVPPPADGDHDDG